MGSGLIDGLVLKMALSDFTKSPKSFKFDCIRSREHSSEISCSVTRTCLQMKMSCQKKFNDEEMAARVMMMMQNHAQIKANHNKLCLPSPCYEYIKSIFRKCYFY